MKIFSVVGLSLLLAGIVQGAQDHSAPTVNSAAAPVPSSKIDPAKEADLRHLLEVTGTASIVQQMIANMEKSIKPLMAQSLPPGEYRDKLIDLFFQRFNSKLDAKRLLDLAAVRYDEDFSDDEIKGLITFYETPLGQKVVTLLPKLTSQLQQDGQNLGQQLGREAMMEVLSEHLELAQALQAASQKVSAGSQ